MNVLHSETKYMCTSTKHWIVKHPNSMFVGNDIGFKRLISHKIYIDYDQSIILRLQICRHILLLKIAIHL